MKIFLSPQHRPGATLTVIKDGDKLRINGDLFSFVSLPDGATVNDVPCPFIDGPVERVNGDLQLTLVLPHCATPEQWQAFPDPIIDPPDGTLDLPFDTYVTVTEQIVGGGKNVITTITKWHQPDEISTVFVADPKPIEDDLDVDA